MGRRILNLSKQWQTCGSSFGIRGEITIQMLHYQPVTVSSHTVFKLLLTFPFWIHPHSNDVTLSSIRFSFQNPGVRKPDSQHSLYEKRAGLFMLLSRVSVLHVTNLKILQEQIATIAIDGLHLKVVLHRLPDCWNHSKMRTIARSSI